MPKPRPADPRSNNNSDSTSGAVSNCPGTPSWPTGPPAKSETYSVEDYIRLWEAKNCRTMTPEERKTLARGCIGITAVELGTSGNPNLSNCYDTLDQAKARAKAMQEECAKSGRTPMIFSKRFYSDGKPYTPDPVTGKVDMSGYQYKAKPGFVNFDYGFYDEASNSWWHANHKDPGMKVYRSTLEHYSRPLQDFDKQVFGVACGKH